MGLFDELGRSDQRHQSGELSDQEYEKAKAALLAPTDDPGPPKPPIRAVHAAPTEEQVRRWPMLLHLSQLAWLIVLPLSAVIFQVAESHAGPVVAMLNSVIVWALLPVMIWRSKRNEMPDIDAHGRVVANWIISALIYPAIAFLLCALTGMFGKIGPFLAMMGAIVVVLPLSFVLFLSAIAFPILGGNRAARGKVWKYPLSIRFFR